MFSFVSREIDELTELNFKSKSIMDLAENLVNQSVKFYRKPDDILVIVAKVVENKNASLQQFYSNQTNKQHRCWKTKNTKRERRLNEEENREKWHFKYEKKKKRIRSFLYEL